VERVVCVSIIANPHQVCTASAEVVMNLSVRCRAILILMN
jgi:hypothetical protein